jgi:hypothetical protein
VYQTIYDTAIQPTFNPAILKPITDDLQKSNFCAEALSPKSATYRDGDRYVTFLLEDGCLFLRLGVGSHDSLETTINSMRLDEMVGFLYGGLKRGCHAMDEKAIHECLAGALRDLKEFAHEFLRGDFRPFLRVLAIKKREEREAEKAKLDATQHIYLA